jgi:hypothetical protein
MNQGKDQNGDDKQQRHRLGEPPDEEGSHPERSEGSAPFVTLRERSEQEDLLFCA